MVGNWANLGLAILILQGCAQWKDLRPYNQVLVGMAVGGVVGLMSRPDSNESLIAATMAAGASGSLIGLYHLNQFPYDQDQKLKALKLLDQGSGRFKFIQDLKTEKVDWKLYKTDNWIRMKENEYWYVDKQIQFYPQP